MDGWQRSRGGLATTRTATAPVAVGVGLAVVLLGGWAGQQVFAPEETSVTCVSWAGVPDDESREKAASIVLDGRVLGTSGQRPMFGERATGRLTAGVGLLLLAGCGPETGVGAGSACLDGETGTTSFCTSAVRWP